MRILFNRPPKPPGADPAPDAGRPIRQPKGWTSAWLALSLGIVLLSVVVAVSIAYSVLFPEAEANSSFHKEAIPWLGILITLALGVLAHEALHASLHPDRGLSDATTFFVDWRRIQFGVYYEGLFPRGRWIAMRLLPLLVFTILPLAVFLGLYSRMTYALETYLIILTGW